MDNLKHSNNIQALIGFFQSYSPKKAINFLLTLSVFSFSVYVFTFSMQVFIYSFEKNCMFLVCNGLLGFIVKSSGLIGNSSLAGSTVNSDGHATQIDNFQKTELALTQRKASHSMEQVVVEVDDDEEQGSETGQVVTVKEKETELFVARDHEGDGGEENGLITSADHEENELQRIELLSTEELNKKCEEFIRKMREVINFEARQLVVV